MYTGQATCPVILRAPMGGHRGYGPTHSQSLEKHFVGIPHLRVVAASLFHDPRAVFADFLDADSPVFYVEHKLLYPLQMRLPESGRVGVLRVRSQNSDGMLPTVCLSAVPREDCSATVIAYGYQAWLAAEVIERLAVSEEIFAELLVPAQIAPIDWSPIKDSATATGRVVTVEEGAAGWSWGSEVAAVLSHDLFGELRGPVEVVASAASVIPAARAAEGRVLVGSSDIEAAIRSVA
jgi:acetoin:2,6-dichlorophenolindophenol oxidoreductase subunit beta